MHKTRITQTELKKALSDELSLEAPSFSLEAHAGKISGSVVSDTFAGWDDARRQREIWDALERRYNKDAVKLVGTLLAYTQAEWNVTLD